MVLLSLLWKLAVDFIYSLYFSSAVAVSHYQNEVLVKSYVVHRRQNTFETGGAKPIFHLLHSKFVCNIFIRQ